MSQLGTVYATKRRRRNGKSLKPPPKDGVTKSNPSKRHRERLNAELDLLASLLPFEQNILSKLDRLSILRLSVSYLRTKSYFQVVMHKEKEENGMLPHIHAHDGYRTRELASFEHGLLDGDMFLQALNGFLMILTCDGEVFFATHSIESYLGFHQSDIVHQSVYELVHSEDREELQRQLLWNSFLPADMSSMQLADTLAPDKALYLERSFTVRFRCLLDNTSGFLRLDIRGRIKILHGQNRKTEEPPLALFAYCTPFGPPSLLEIPHKENMFKSKHKLDFSLVSMDQRGKLILGYSDAELVNLGGYDLVHYDDLAYVASAHQELLKTGASGMIAYRYQKKDGEWQWLQTSSRLVYKNSKPDFVICTHRQLMDEEGHDLLGKRTMDFKVSYLDTGLASTYFSEADQLVVPPSSSPNSLPPPVTPTRPNRRYKTQLRDFLSTCRTKRKMQQQPQQTSPLAQVTSPAPVVEYLPDPAVAVAAAYSNLNPMYTTSPYATAADNIYMGTPVHSTNFYPVTENLFHQYRLQGVGGYYTDYHHSGAPTSAYVTNGFLSYDGYAITSKDDKWQEPGKYYSGYSSGYGSPTSTPQQILLKTPKSSPHVMEVVSCSSDGPSPVGSSAGAGHVIATNSSSATSNGGSITPKIELQPVQDPYERQTVLMWGTQSSGIPINTISNRHDNVERSPPRNGLTYSNNNNNNNNNENDVVTSKWNGSTTTLKDMKTASTPTDSYQLQHDDSRLYSSSSHTTSPSQQQHRLSNNNNSGVANVATTAAGGNVGNIAVSSSTIVTPSTTVAEQQHQQQQHTNNTSNNNNNITTQRHHSNNNNTRHSRTTAVTSPNASTQNLHSVTPQQHPHITTLQQQPQAADVVPTHPHHHYHHSHPHHHHHHAAHHQVATPTATHRHHTTAHHSHTTHPHIQHYHHTSHHAHHGTTANTAHNGSEIMLSQQQQQQLPPLSYSQQQLQPLTGCASTNSASSSPSCTSPTTATTNHQLQPALISSTGTLINGLATSQESSTITIDATASPYHQLAIIASPIVLTATGDNNTTTTVLLNNDDDIISSNGATHLQCLNNRNQRGQQSLPPPPPSPHHQQHHHHHHALTPHHHHHHHHHHHPHTHQLLHRANITAHTALSYAPNPAATTAYVIGGSAATVSGILSNVEQQPDGSPLLSFSEVTNTLLNQ